MVPASPSAVRLLAFWNWMTACSVTGPNFPSALPERYPRLISAYWSWRTFSPLEPRQSVEDFRARAGLQDRTAITTTMSRHRIRERRTMNSPFRDKLMIFAGASIPH